MQFQNKVLIQGFLTKKPELKTTQNGKNYTRFSVCYNYSYKDKKTNEWVKIPYFFGVTAWDKQATYAVSLEKGNAISVFGTLKQDRWIDTKGITKNDKSIVATEIQKLDFAKSNVEDLPTSDITEDVPVSDDDIPQEEIFVF